MSEAFMLPSLQAEMNINAKRMKTLSQLEHALSKFSAEVREISANCPFDSTSVSTQLIVNDAHRWAINFGSNLTNVINSVRAQHFKDVDVLHREAIASEEEKEKAPKEATPEELEDAVAIMKTHLAPELLASREKRRSDAAREEAFAQQLRDIQSSYLSTKSQDEYCRH